MNNKPTRKCTWVYPPGPSSAVLPNVGPSGGRRCNREIHTGMLFCNFCESRYKTYHTKTSIDAMIQEAIRDQLKFAMEHPEVNVSYNTSLRSNLKSVVPSMKRCEMWYLP
jgi:hypothetical protein